MEKPPPTSPYDDLPATAFWRTGVAGQPPDAIAGLYKKKFPIGRETRIATAGSCFAQHIARHLRARDFSVIDAEPAPPGLTPEAGARFGYGLFSARYANIYTARQLRQVFEEAFGAFMPTDAVWEKEGRYFDALRPSVEPGGLGTREAVLDQRRFHLARVQDVLRQADVFVFTLGLTEVWLHGPSGTVYPTAPGVIAGRYDPAIHTFHNFTVGEVCADLSAFRALAKSVNADMRLLLTVSPVPLTATASGEHVLSATTYSKAVLRAAAGQLVHEHDDVDYFPSYEIITGAQAKGAYFEENLRSVRADGVAAVMDAFFAQHGDGGALAVAAVPQDDPSAPDEDAVCEDILLDAFAR